MIIKMVTRLNKVYWNLFELNSIEKQIEILNIKIRRLQ